MAEEIKKCKSVLELSKYKVGETLYWVVLRPVSVKRVEITTDDRWLISEMVHPKTLYERGFSTIDWPHKNKKLPRLHAHDFVSIVELVSNGLVIERFKIEKIRRCPNTGEYFYQNDIKEWMPESNLFSTLKGARSEKNRIRQMVQEWSETDWPDKLNG